MILKDFINMEEQQIQQIDDKAILLKIGNILKTGRVIENLNNVLIQIKAMNPKTQAQYQNITNSISSAIQSIGGLVR